MAEREGFEPSVEALVPYNGLANRRFRPLSHLSQCNLPTPGIYKRTLRTGQASWLLYLFTKLNTHVFSV